MKLFNNMVAKKSFLRAVPLLLVAAMLVGFAPQRGDKKKKKGKNEPSETQLFREEVAGYRQECKSALKPYKYSFGRTTFFNYKPYNTLKEVEVSMMLDATYKFTFNAQGVTMDKITVRVYNRPSDYNTRVLLYEKKGVGGGSFHFTSEQLMESMREHYKKEGVTGDDLDKLLLPKVYIDYVIPAIDQEYEEDPETGRRKAIIKKGAIVFASGYENLEAR